MGGRATDVCWGPWGQLRVVVPVSWHEPTTAPSPALSSSRGSQTRAPCVYTALMSRQLCAGPCTLSPSHVLVVFADLQRVLWGAGAAGHPAQHQPRVQGRLAAGSRLHNGCVPQGGGSGGAGRQGRGRCEGQVVEALEGNPPSPANSQRCCPARNVRRSVMHPCRLVFGWWRAKYSATAFT